MSGSVLTLKTGAMSGRQFRLDKERLVIGRHPDCDIVLDQMAVSRQHVAIALENGLVFAEDLHSRNGTFVNGRPLTGRRLLEDGDELLICDQKLIFTSNEPATSDSIVIGADDSLTVHLVDDGYGDSNIVSQVPVHEPVHESGPSGERKLKAMIGINMAIGGSLSLDEVLPRMLDGLFEIFPQAERGFVLLVDQESKRLVLRARKTLSPPEPGPLRLSLSLMERVVQRRRAILSADTSADRRFNATESVADCRIRSVMCVPFIRADGEVVGVVQVDSWDVRKEFRHQDLDVLAAIATGASKAIEQAIEHDQLVGQEQLKRDLELAHRVQRGLLPAKPPEIAGYTIFDFYEPARQIGGDFFNYVPLPSGCTAIVLADVSGKGVSAALVMASLSADVRYCLASEPDVAVAVGRINESFCKSGWDDRFATMVVVVIDPATHVMKVVNAGHLPACYRDPQGRVRPMHIDQGGLPLGIDPRHTYVAYDLPVQPGGTVVLYTDGISEAMDHEHRQYGTDRLLRMLEKPGATPEEVGRHVLRDVDRHAAGQVRSDDICLVCIGRSAEVLSASGAASLAGTTLGRGGRSSADEDDHDSFAVG